MAEDVIVLTGIKETLDALKKFDKNAVRRFNRVVNTELTFAEATAKLSVPFQPPMSGWRERDAIVGKTRNGAGWPGWSQDRIRTGIKKTRVQGKVRRNYTTSAGALLNESAEGSIFEVAGRKSDGAGTGVSFISTLNSRFGPASRSIWRTVDRDRVRIEANVKAALEIAKAELQKHLNKERA